MSDFLGDLAAIKADMIKSTAPKNSNAVPKNPNKDEIKKQLVYYCGRNPYLLCNLIVKENGKDWIIL